MNIDRKSKAAVLFVLMMTSYIAFGAVTVIGDDGDIVVSIDPISKTVSPDDTFSVNVSCVPGQPMKSFEFRLSFNASLLQANSVVEGDIFDGFGTFFNDGTINNTAGTIVDIYDLIVGAGTVSDSGTLVTISFTAKVATGISYLNLVSVGVTNATQYLPVTVLNGNVSVQVYTLTVNTVGSGTVTPASGGSYLAGTVVDLEAIPDTGYEFDSWSGDLSGTNNQTTITMSSDKTITATFVEEAPATITLVQQKTYAHSYNSPSTGISVTLDSPATANNLLVTVVAIDKASGTITVPTGFTLVQKGEGGISSGAMAYKIATGGETTISWTWTATEEGSVWIGEYSGLAATAVLDVSAENEAYLSTATNTISTGTTSTTTQANELAIALFASDSGNSVGSTRTWTNGFTTIAEVTSTSGSPFVNVASTILDTTGTVESTLTHNGSDESYAMIATFKALTQ